MKTYKVTKLPANGAFRIEGNILTGSVPVNIPESDGRKHSFISYYVRIFDLQKALEMVSYISPNNSYTINRALFIAALADLIKCFEGSDKYTILNEHGFKKYAREAYKEFRRYKDLRNQHYMHVSNSMTEAFAFLLVAPEESEKLFGGVPSVIVDCEEVDFLEERNCLEWVISEAKGFAVTEFDKMADSLTKTYESKSRDELLSYGVVQPIPAKCEISEK